MTFLHYLYWYWHFNLISILFFAIIDSDKPYSTEWMKSGAVCIQILHYYVPSSFYALEICHFTLWGLNISMTKLLPILRRTYS